MKTARVFVPLSAGRWPAIQVSSTKSPDQTFEMPLNCLLRLDGAVYYLPVYLSLGLLRLDFPKAEVMELDLEVLPLGPRNEITYSVGRDADGRLIATTTESAPPDNPPGS